MAKAKSTAAETGRFAIVQLAGHCVGTNLVRVKIERETTMLWVVTDGKREWTFSKSGGSVERHGQKRLLLNPTTEQIAVAKAAAKANAYVLAAATIRSEREKRRNQTGLPKKKIRTNKELAERAEKEAEQAEKRAAATRTAAARKLLWPIYGTRPQNMLATIAKRLENARDDERRDLDADADLTECIEKLTILAELEDTASLLLDDTTSPLWQEAISRIENQLGDILAYGRQEPSDTTPNERTAEEIEHCRTELYKLACHENIASLLTRAKPNGTKGKTGKATAEEVERCRTNLLRYLRGE